MQQYDNNSSLRQISTDKSNILNSAEGKPDFKKDCSWRLNKRQDKGQKDT